ncbi:MAG: response regulator [Geitlerinemataceae cyanobacterium]
MLIKRQLEVDSPYYTVLLIEDAEADSDLYRHYLKNDPTYAYDVRLAQSGEEAIESILRRSPDLMVVDFSLPDIDGLSLIAQLQSLPQLADVPVVMTTGNGNPQIALQAMKQNIEDYLVKGELSFEAFVRVIHTAIATLEERRDAASRALQGERI